MVVTWLDPSRNSRGSNLGLGLVFEEEALGRERWGDFLA